MEVSKLINVLNGMIFASNIEPKTEGWVKDFLIEVKSTLEKQEQEINQLSDLYEKLVEHREKVLIENYELKKELNNSSKLVDCGELKLPPIDFD